MLPLSQIMRKNQIAYHSYADDTQIYLALSPNDYSPIDSLCQCIDEINSWMCQNFLQLNKEKTEVIAFGNKDEVLKVNAYLDSRGQTTKNQVRNLGVILETDLSFSSHVKAVTKSAYYHLKNIARIRCFVSSHDLEKLVHVFITSRVDYCNGLLTGLPKKTIRQLQLIQNAAARILTRTRKSEHITPVLRSLHWLPVTFRIDFKVLLLVYKSLNGLGPKYMADMLTEYKPNRPLRSLGSSQLEIPRVHTKQGESAFSYYAARSWNQLPEEIRCAKTLATFKSRLKTHLFSCAFVEWALCYVRTDCIILCIILFYLTVLNFILNQFLYHFKIPCLLFLTPCFYCCEWLFHFLCKALWITTVYEMCYINKLALPCLYLNQDLTKFYKDPPPVGDFSITPQLKLRLTDLLSYCDGENIYFSQKIF